MEHFFTTYVRTKTLFKRRLKDLDDYSTVKIYVYELKKLGVDNGPLLYDLKQRGEIWYDNEGNFKALKDGPIRPDLLERTKKTKKKVELTDLHLWMREHLKHVTLVTDDDDVPVYFKAFLKLKNVDIDQFFQVDAFSGRVHTPIVNLKENFRKCIRLYGQKITSLDVKQMQPTILAKVLHDSIGDNPFSNAIFNGKDVYVLLQEKNDKLKTRSDAKKMLFQLIFGKPKNEIGAMFTGDTKWVDWINKYKSEPETGNPHKGKTHTNLAWLLQYSEVMVMSDIWRELMKRNIPFLTIHDDVLCMERDKEKVKRVMDRELSKHFRHYELNMRDV